MRYRALLDIESVALRAVKRQERRKGGKPQRMRPPAGYDLRSRGRLIEVKTIRRGSGRFVRLNQRQHKVLRASKNYWVYLVDLSGKKAKIFQFNRRQVLRRIKPRSYYSFPFSKSDVS